MPYIKSLKKNLALPFILACSGLLAAEPEMDPLEYYLLQAFQAPSASERIALNHIGVDIELSEGNYVVSASLEGYPAHEAGIERGDIILTVNGMSYHPVNSFNQTQTIAGNFAADDSLYTVEYQRSGNLQQVSISPVFENLFDSYRSAVENSVQKFSSGNKVVGYIRLWGFSRSTNDLISLNRLMNEFNDCDGLIVDLRNSYGYLSEIHLNLFMPSGNALSDGNKHSELNSIPLSQTSDYYRRPIALLVNEDTDGDAVLMTNLLHQLERIVSVGQTTVDGINEGIIPEQLVDYPLNLNTRSDPQYETAVSILLGII